MDFTDLTIIKGVTMRCLLGGLRTGALAIALQFLLATAASAGLFSHTIPKVVPAVDVNTGQEMMAPPVPYGCYAKDHLGYVHKRIGSLTSAFGGMGLLCNKCGGAGCGECGGLGRLFNHDGACGPGCGHDGLFGRGGGSGCGLCGGVGCGLCRSGAAGSACRGCGGAGCGLCGKGKGLLAGHGHSYPAATPQASPAPQVLVAQPKHAHAHHQAPGKATTFVSTTPQAGPVATGQGVVIGSHGHGGKGLKGVKCGSCGGRGCGLCGGNGFGGQGGGCGFCGGKGCGKCANAGGSSICSNCGGNGCFNCNGLGKILHPFQCSNCGGQGCKNCLGNGAGHMKSLVDKLLHRNRIQYFVGAGGPVPLTPGYVPYVVTTRSPRDFFAFPPMSDIDP
jgi:hypothetical protein